MGRRRYAEVAILVAVAVAVQLLAQAGGKVFYLTQLTMTAYYTAAALGLCLFMGYAGQISLGQAGFFAIGGYTSAYLTTLDLSSRRGEALFGLLARAHVLVARPDPYGGEALSVHPWAAFACALALALAVAFTVGVPVLRLKGHYLAMATLGVGTIVYSVVLGTQRFGAADGLSGVPPFRLLPGIAVAGSAALRVQNYYVAWGLVAASMLLFSNLVHSRVGRALRAIHGAEDAASAMGVHTARVKLHAFVLSAAMAAVAGVLLTHFNGGIGPSESSIMKSVRYVAIVAVGGMGSLWGTLTASAVLNFLSLRGTFGTLDDAVFATVLILVMLFAPDGILAVDVRSALQALLRRARPSKGEA
jgi:branched-chain amino acid transport system permease protein